MQKVSVLCYPKNLVLHFVLNVSNDEDQNQKLSEVSQQLELPGIKSIQLQDGSVINIEQLDCDSLTLDDYDIEIIED